MPGRAEGAVSEGAAGPKVAAATARSQNHQNFRAQSDSPKRRQTIGCEKERRLKSVEQNLHCIATLCSFVPALRLLMHLLSMNTQFSSFSRYNSHFSTQRRNIHMFWTNREEVTNFWNFYYNWVRAPQLQPALYKNAKSFSKLRRLRFFGWVDEFLVGNIPAQVRIPYNPNFLKAEKKERQTLLLKINLASLNQFISNMHNANFHWKETKSEVGTMKN